MSVLLEEPGEPEEGAGRGAVVGGLIKPAEATQLAYLFFLEQKKKK